MSSNYIQHKDRKDPDDFGISEKPWRGGRVTVQEAVNDF